MPDTQPTILGPEDPDYMPHLTPLETNIAERITYCGTEVGTIDHQIRLAVKSALSRFCLHADTDDITIRIVVDNVTEDTSWPGTPPTPIGLNRIAEHCFQQNSHVTGTRINGDTAIVFNRGANDSGWGGFKLTLIHAEVDQ